MGINKFISSKSREQNAVEKFSKLIKGKTKQEIRSIEMAMLRPVPIPVYRGRKPGLSSHLKKTISFTFSSARMVELIRKHIRTGLYKGINSYDTGPIEALFTMIDEGHISWDGKSLSFRKEEKESSPNGQIDKTLPRHDHRIIRRRRR